MPSEDNSILKSAGQSSCLGENTEQYINFSVPTETEVKRIEEGFTNQKWKRLNNTKTFQFQKKQKLKELKKDLQTKNGK